MPAATAIKLVQRWEQNWGITAEILGLTAPSMADDERARRVVPPLPGTPTRCCRRSRFLTGTQHRPRPYAGSRPS